ncbi:MAG TPA: DUF29 domain-containing protein [Acetobacteraceae bacterium]|nr:DUF29 domain-containing protein [Acetobacteraceae bacterium]
MSDLYHTDLVLWSARQAAALRSATRERHNLPVDWENVAEEIESLGASERRALTSHLRTVVEHLMKLEASPAADPRNGWIATALHARDDIDDVLRTSPSLRREVAEIIERQVIRARRMVRLELARLGEAVRVDLDTLTYAEKQVLGDWLPETTES